MVRDMSHLSTLIDRYERAGDKRERTRAIINMIQYVGVPNPEATTVKEIAITTMKIMEFLRKFEPTISHYDWKKREFKPRRLGQELVEMWLYATELHDRADELKEEGREPNEVLKEDIEKLMNETDDLYDRFIKKIEKDKGVEIGL